MKFSFLVLIAALFIAGIAAWFSIADLVAIFASAAIPIAIMGTSLEVGKILAASWLYRHWKSAPFLLKTYLTIAVIALMIITSMGIFGYLSKAHLEQTADLGPSILQIERLDEQIAREQRQIERAEIALNQLDGAIDEYTERGYVTRGLEAREAQQPERERLAELIVQSEEEISEFQSRRTELNRDIQILENEVGPIKYLAQLVYGNDDRDLLEETVRLFILILVAVFDPLAVALLLAANYTLLRYGVELEREGPIDPNKSSEPDEPDESNERTEVEEPVEDKPQVPLPPAMAKAESEPKPAAVPVNNATVGRRV